MGVWPYLVRKFRNNDLRVISRKESGSTATGYAKQHSMQQQYIINKAFLISTASRKLQTGESSEDGQTTNNSLSK
jgi:2-oxoglutarate dehydrogenase E1 component